MVKIEYVIITPARNEEAYIERTIQSVVSQKVLPKKWVIVSDGSTDRTDKIVSGYAERHDFIQLLQKSRDSKRNFGAQVHAINAGYKQFGDIDFQFIGNLDADVSFEPDYYERMLEKFQQNPQLGLAGGVIHEKYNGEFKSRPYNSVRSVAHAVQLFRRECYEAIGGYIPLKYGGPDWYAEVMARMKGWQVESFPELRVLHHRQTASAGGIMQGRFCEGLRAYSIGSHPLFEVLKTIRRIRANPYVIGSLVRLGGFIWGYCRREDRMVSDTFIEYIRKEQMQRLKSHF